MLVEVAQKLKEIEPTHIGYPETRTTVPYFVVRPYMLDEEDMALCGQTTWNARLTVYCCAASVEASYNLATSAINSLQGKRVNDKVLSCSIGYVGGQVEGHYETQVTVQYYTGELS